MKEVARGVTRDRRYRRHRGRVRLAAAEAALSLIGRRRRAGRAELQQLDVTVVGDEDVGRLEIRVNDAAPVRGDERIGELDAEVDDAIGRQRSFRRDGLVERAPVEQFDDEVGASVLLARIVDRADVRVGDERRDARFPPEALERVGPRHRLGSQELERDVALEAEIARLVDLGRAVAADPREHFVVGDAQRQSASVHARRAA